MKRILPIIQLCCLLWILNPGQAAAQESSDDWLGADKAAHFGVTATLAAGGYALASNVTDDIAGKFSLGASLAMGAGLAKEAADAAGFGAPSWKDFAWDVIGTTFGLGLALVVDNTSSPSVKVISQVNAGNRGGSLVRFQMNF